VEICGICHLLKKRWTTGIASSNSWHDYKIRLGEVQAWRTIFTLFSLVRWGRSVRGRGESGLASPHLFLYNLSWRGFSQPFCTTACVSIHFKTEFPGQKAAKVEVINNQPSLQPPGCITVAGQRSGLAPPIPHYAPLKRWFCITSFFAIIFLSYKKNVEVTVLLAVIATLWALLPLPIVFFHQATTEYSSSFVSLKSRTGN